MDQPALSSESEEDITLQDNRASPIVSTTNIVTDTPSVTFLREDPPALTTASLTSMASQLHIDGTRPKDQRIAKRKHSSSDKTVSKRSTSHHRGHKAPADARATHGSHRQNTPVKQPSIDAALQAAGLVEKAPNPAGLSKSQQYAQPATAATDVATAVAAGLQAATAAASAAASTTTSVATTTVTTAPAATTSTAATAVEDTWGVNIDASMAPPSHIKIPIVTRPGARATIQQMTMTSPLQNNLAPYSQAIGQSNRQYSAPAFPSSFTPIPNYNTSTPKPTDATEATQTSSHHITFHDPEEQIKFTIMPQALSIWRQARSSFVGAEKAKIRAAKLQEWATAGLTPDWAIGHGPTPQQFIPHDDATINHVGENLKLHAIQTLHIHATGLMLEAKMKDTQGHALFKSLQALYEQDPEGLHKLTEIIGKYVKNDAHHTLTQLHKQEAAMRASPKSARDLFLVRNPPPPSPETTAAPRRERRRHNSRSRSPYKRGSSSRKRRRSRSNSNPRSNRGGRNNSRPRQQQQSNRDSQWEQKQFALLKKFMRNQNK